MLRVDLGLVALDVITIPASLWPTASAMRSVPL
jgi:hypothetical protein